MVEPFEEVEGNRHLRGTLVRIYGDDYSSRRGSEGSPVNVLFYDLDEREGRWLFSGSAQIVLRDEAVGDSAHVRAFVYELVESDTDGDGRLGAEDARTIAVSDPTGRRLVRVIDGADRLRQLRRLDEDTVLLLYEGGGQIGAVEVNLADLRVEAKIALPPIPEAGS